MIILNGVVSTGVTIAIMIADEPMECPTVSFDCRGLDRVETERVTNLLHALFFHDRELMLRSKTEVRDRVDFSDARTPEYVGYGRAAPVLKTRP